MALLDNFVIIWRHLVAEIEMILDHILKLPPAWTNARDERMLAVNAAFSTTTTSHLTSTFGRLLSQAEAQRSIAKKVRNGKLIF